MAEASRRSRSSSMVVGVPAGALCALVAACGGSSTPSVGPAPAASAPTGSDAAAPPSSSPLDAGAPAERDATVPTSPDDASAPAPDAGGDDGPPDAGDLVQRLLDLTRNCPQANVVSKHSYTDNNGAPVDVCKLAGAVYYTAKMAIDCDGRTTNNCPGTGANKDCCYFNDTSFHNTQGQPLAAEFDPYVVLPLDFEYPGLDQNNGGNVIAVLYKGQLEFAVFGDQGPTDKIGEASFRTAQVLGINPSPANGGVNGDVTYIVFVGDGTQPKDIEDVTEIQSLGASLAQQLVQQN